jgi:hypothetical protein
LERVLAPLDTAPASTEKEYKIACVTTEPEISRPGRCERIEKMAFQVPEVTLGIAPAE